MGQEEAQPRILCVDDEVSVLQGLERTLFEHFDITCATSGKEGLQHIQQDEPYAVVISDMRMPEMDGATFLAEARKRAPNTVRILLTGHSDINSAIAAVNHGNIFRFLSKPCEAANLIGVINDAVAHHRLLTLEKDLLENTLGGAVKALAKLLEIQVPIAFRKASAMSRIVQHLCRALKVADAWIYESAALLSRAGYVVLPGETLDSIDAGKPLSDDEKRMVEGAFQTAAALLEEIPRMEVVSAIIRALPQGMQVTASDKRVEFGVKVLHTADRLDTELSGGVPLKSALVRLKGLPPAVRDALAKLPRDERKTEVRFLQVAIADLKAGMVLEQDVVAQGGMAVARRGCELTTPMIERLKNFHQRRGIPQPIRVQAPSGS